jgi:tetratricopeptide (TPR) repeat protein
MKKTKFLFAAIALTGALNAQTLQEAIAKSQNERYEVAGSDFRALIAKEPNKGENYFFYGENFFNRGELDSANAQYQKGSEVNATSPLNYVGLGKVQLYKGKEADAKTLFYKATTLGGGKHTEVMRRIAEAYIEAELANPDEAINQLNQAIKLEPNNPRNYILMGDALLKKNPSDGGPAIKQYQKATDLNPKSALGTLSQGKLYQRGRNYNLAIDLYKKAIELDPTFAPGYRELAEVYGSAGQNAKAIEYWKKYLELNNSNYARRKYQNALVLNKQYQEGVTEYESLKTTGYSDLYLERLGGYGYYELGDKTDKDAYNKGLAAINKFFEISSAFPGFKYLVNDYKYKGLLLWKTGKDSLAVVELEKGIAIDSVANCELWANVAGIWMKAKRYDKTIAAFEKKAACPKGLSATDNFDLGRANYYAGAAKWREASTIKDAKAKSAKEAEGTPFFIKADTAFQRLTIAKPEFPAGFFWRGKANVYIDPTSEKGLAKPHYEKAIAITKPEEKTGTYKTNMIEAYEYFGYYYLAIAKEKDKATEYFKLLQELDPTNEKAKSFFNPPKGAAPKK